MARLIDADALVRQYKINKNLFLDTQGDFSSLPPKDKERVDELDNCIAQVINAPTVDAVEVKHGRWISHEGYEECDICHTKAIYSHNFCPNCGAKMDGDTE
jgi:hypothetical protein